ncbi:hypothetical protein [Acetobacter estunensis]|uniref:hypothetical protein n=1 Tax=Acetobacter estunensis TaxID=104097 RepID=UPI001C2DB247|nr:hypothetical protein [Acetobacter estunensis]MBV1835741.1 hypothetical protein [Acetobacter estunensis]MBV1835998.1 hypothetical protein [Acetobacter estunensis]
MNGETGTVPAHESTADLAQAFPIRTHALNAADHGLIQQARDVTAKELRARATVDDTEADPLFAETTDGIRAMADIKPATWDGWFARQVAFSVWTGASKPCADSASEWAEFASGRDAMTMLANPPPLADAELIDICQQAAELRQKEDDHTIPDDEAERYADRFWDEVKRIRARRAMTIDGARALARLIEDTDGSLPKNPRRLYMSELVETLVRSLAESTEAAAPDNQEVSEDYPPSRLGPAGAFHAYELACRRRAAFEDVDAAQGRARTASGMGKIEANRQADVAADLAAALIKLAPFTRCETLSDVGAQVGIALELLDEAISLEETDPASIRAAYLALASTLPTLVRVAGRDLTRAIDPIFFSDEQAMRAGAQALTGDPMSYQPEKRWSVRRDQPIREIGSPDAVTICAYARAGAKAIADTSFIGLSHAYHEVSKALERLPACSDREFNDLLDQKYLLLGRLGEISGNTSDDLVAKSLIVMERLPEYLHVFESEKTNPDIQIAISLAHDVVKYLGERTA